MGSPSAPELDVHEAQDLATSVASWRDELLSAWIAALEGGEAGPLRPGTLPDHLHVLLAALSHGLSSLAESSPEIDRELAESYALGRMADELELPQCLDELQILRALVRRMWSERRGRDPRELAAIERVLDTLVAEVVSAYSSAQRRFLTALDRMSSMTRDELPVHELLRRLLDEVLIAVRAADFACAFLLEGDRLVLSAVAGHAEYEPFSVAVGESFAGKIAATGKPAFTPIAASDPEITVPIARQQHVRAYYGVPLISNRRLVGVICVGSLTQYSFSKLTLHLLRVFAERSAEVVAFRQWHEALRRAAEVSESGDAFIAVDRAWRIVAVNGAQERMSGLSRDELLGKNLWALFPHAAGPELSYWRECHRVMEQRLPVHFEEYLPSRDLWTDVSAFPTGDGGMAVSFRDVTERARALAELRERDETMRAILDNASSGIFMVDAQGCTNYLNPSARRLLDFTLEELAGKSLHDMVHHTHPDGRPYPAEECPMWRVIHSGTPVRDLEETAIRRDGSFVPIEYSSVPIRRGGKIVGAVVEARDISERLRFQAELRKSDARMRRILDANIIGIYNWNVDGSIPYSNQAFLDLIGATREDVESGRLRWEDVSPPDYREIELQKFAELKATGRHAPFERELLHRDGHRVPVVLASAMMPDEPGLGMAFVVDLTERKRYEAELERLFVMSPDALCVVGMDGRAQRINPAFEKILGYTDAELRGTPVHDLVHPEDRATSERAFRTLVEEGQITHVTERVRRKDGEYRWMAWHGSVDPASSRVIAVGRDVTDARRAEQFERQLVGIVSHDLRNPLSAVVMGTTAMLARPGTLEPPTLALVERMRSSAERASRLINDLLDFTKARIGGGIPIRRQKLDFDAAVAKAVEELRPNLGGREVRLEQGGAGEGEWDPDRLAQLVGNLLTNAIRYSAEGTAVKVATWSEDGEVALQVHNEGAPIPSELIPHLFEPMTRGTESRPKVAAGVGLGLYIVDHIVRRHGGSIRVTSTEADGTAFTVRLPRMPPS